MEVQTNDWVLQNIWKYGSIIKQEFLVMALDHEILLGLDWFRKTKRLINPSEASDTFPGREIQLNQTEVKTGCLMANCMQSGESYIEDDNGWHDVWRII